MKTLLLTLLFSSSVAQAARFVVEAKRPLNLAQMKLSDLSIHKFVEQRYPNEYFSRLYTVSGNITKEQLQKVSWVKNVEPGVELMRFSLLPAENPERLVNDELFAYQWGLLNQGQSYVREKDDIHNLPLPGVDGKDVGWKSVYQNIPAGRPIVAVLDSGVDLEHPDLKDNLWKNEKECGLDSSLDNDKNTYPGDCHGWNFTEAKSADAAKVPQDNDGHGTHVAGLVAAAKNGIGIVGANPNALIMPIKVMKDSNSKSDIPPSESFALGIVYATDMGAHIINLSLGWPRSLETSHLRNAIAYALSRNVIIIAAAGNNNSSEPLFPCAYDGVICTAASTLDGRYAGFSNFGGHVDAVVPGEGILSLYPTIYEPDFFSIPGYDIKSGTSQSAPLLAGLVSILKAQEPRITIDEVFARLYKAQRNPDQRKYVLGGDVTWDILNQKVEASVIRPILKRVRQIVLQGQNQETKLNIPIRNYGLETSNVTVKLESLSKGLSVLIDTVVLDLMRISEVKTVPFSLRVEDLNMESNVRLKVTITSEEGERSYINDVPVSRDIKSESGFKKLPFSFNKSAYPMGTIDNGKLIPFLATMESYGKSAKHEFFLRRTLSKEKKLQLTVFSRKGASLIEAPKQIEIEKFVSIVNFIRLDLNFDGKEDYLVHTVNEDETGKYFEFSFFDEKMDALWAGFQGVRVKIDLLISSMNDLSFSRMDHPKLGKMMVPVFFTDGQLPKQDQSMDFFGRWDSSRENRLYYLEPILEEKAFRIRSLTHHAWRDGLKKELNSKWYETVVAENILPVSLSDAALGRVRVVVSVGQGTKRSIFVSTFDTKNTLRGKSLPQLVLQTEGVGALYTVSPAGLDATGDVYLNVYDRSRAKIVQTKQTQQSHSLNYTHESETDLIVGHVVSFEKGQDKISILQTRDELVSLTSSEGKVIKSTRPKLRYSFFSAKVLSEMYNPVIYKREGVQAPALYVDSTAVTLNRVYLFEEQQGKLVSSVRNSLIVPFDKEMACKALNPSFSATSQSHEFVFLCFENKEWVIRTYEMK